MWRFSPAGNHMKRRSWLRMCRRINWKNCCKMSGRRLWSKKKNGSQQSIHTTIRMLILMMYGVFENKQIWKKFWERQDGQKSKFSLQTGKDCQWRGDCSQRETQAYSPPCKKQVYWQKTRSKDLEISLLMTSWNTMISEKDRIKGKKSQWMRKK